MSALQLPCVFFVQPLGLARFNFPRTVALSFIWVLIGLASIGLGAAIISALRRRKKEFAKTLEKKYGVQTPEDDEPWDETYAAEDDDGKD